MVLITSVLNVCYREKFADQKYVKNLIGVTNEHNFPTNYLGHPEKHLRFNTIETVSAFCVLSIKYLREMVYLISLARVS
jgi:hypothetical protein